MKPNQQVAFNINGLDDETHDDFWDLFGNKIE